MECKNFISKTLHSIQSIGIVWELIIPFKYAHTQNIHGDGYEIDNSNGDQLGSRGLSCDHKNGRAEKMKITDEKNQPYPRKGTSPEGIFPDQMAAHI